MLSQAAQLLKRDFSGSVEWQVAEARAQLGALEKWIAESAEKGVAAHEVERGLFDGVLQLGFTLFDAFLKLVDPGFWTGDAAKWEGHEINRPRFVKPGRTMHAIGG
jgi:hypothetical protein